MNTLKQLLTDADPLRHERPRLEGERERLRRAILEPRRGAPAAPSRRHGPTTAIVVVVLLSLGYLLWRPGPARVLAAVQFEVRLTEDRAVPGLIVAQLPDSGRLIYLYAETVAGNKDVAQATVVDDGSGRFAVAVDFLPIGARRLQQATRDHIGRPVAILIDGRVVIAPIGRSAIADSAVIAGDLTRADAQRIANGIVPH